MKTYNEYIAELFDAPFKVRELKNPSDLEQDTFYRANIPTKPAQILTIEINAEDFNGVYSLGIGFDVGHQIEITGTVDKFASRIFATVLITLQKDILLRERKFKRKVDEVSIQILDFEQSPSRVKLYKSIVKRFSPKLGFKKSKMIVSGTDILFSITR